MSDMMKTYRKPDGYTIQATPKAFQLFYKKQGFVPVEDEENTGSGELPVKAEADRQEEQDENSSAEVSEESTSAETPEANDREPEAETPEANDREPEAETPEANDKEPKEAKPSTKRKKEEKKADSASEQPAG